MFRGSGTRRENGGRLSPCFAVLILLKSPRMVESTSMEQHVKGTFITAGEFADCSTCENTESGSEDPEDIRWQQMEVKFAI